MPCAMACRRPKTKSSSSLTKIIENAEGRVAITTFSSNVGRIRSIAKAAAAAGREVLLLGSSMKRVCRCCA